MAAATTIGHSVRSRLRAIARKDWSVERSYHFQLGLHAFNVVFTLALYFFLAELVGDAEEVARYDGGYFTFVLVGLLVTSSAAVGLSTFSARISAEQAEGTLEVLLSTPTRLSTLLAGALIVPVLFVAVEVALYIGVAVALFGVRVSVFDVLLALPILALTLLVFSAIGIFAASFIVLTKRGEPFTALTTQASNFLAGVIFPVTLLPTALQMLSHLVPAFYALEALRDVLLTDAGLVDVLDEVAVLAAFTAVLVPAAIVAFGRAVRAAQRTGTLGNY